VVRARPTAAGVGLGPQAELAARAQEPVQDPDLGHSELDFPHADDSRPTL
jgi:hypothetical protein